MMIERSAEERLPVAIAAKRAAKRCDESFRRWATEHGMTHEEACAIVRRQLDERIDLRERFLLQ